MIVYAPRPSQCRTFLLYNRNRFQKGLLDMEREGSVRIPAGCAIAALISKEGRMIAGDVIIRGIATMHDRSNGLGGGFAAYGIYPEHRDQYALHIFFDNKDRRSVCEGILRERFEVVRAERIPTRRIPAITDEPLIWRYFVSPLRSVLAAAQQDEEEYMVRTVTKLNAELSGCYVFSCGKNMGIFKAVGFPEDVGTFYRLEEYKAYSWTAHGRYPTNTPGWWGGAHPFGLLARTIVHNGEISSYDANRRFIEMYGYKCTLLPEGGNQLHRADHRQSRGGAQHRRHHERHRAQRCGHHCHRRFPRRHGGLHRHASATMLESPSSLPSRRATSVCARRASATMSPSSSAEASAQRPMLSRRLHSALTPAMSPRRHSRRSAVTSAAAARSAAATGASLRRILRSSSDSIPTKAVSVS
ncbi:hypothetical protein HMPREF0908_1510 [Selenomonas flueggei ATCC 43531]|uniref:Glutamine amidotransferase type-2 domain-containing protein n=1 Tax=Selenomonas flueggei ATCC 43531 TaxID=638302 RepID=C4V4S6_9FIRM|nr:hypothetical protein HMPREF0908_1510 [Selenomonas flueggei ATCC 43531]